MAPAANANDSGSSDLTWSTSAYAATAPNGRDLFGSACCHDPRRGAEAARASEGNTLVRRLLGGLACAVVKFALDAAQPGHELARQAGGVDGEVAVGLRARL